MLARVHTHPGDGLTAPGRQVKERQTERMKKVTIQGVRGCFHDAAAHHYFRGEDVETVSCETFPEMFQTLAADPSLLGVAAIENTIAGSLLQNHELLRQSGLAVVGELKMRISHVLCALPGQTLDDIREVNSHPMALMQCEAWLRRHPWMKLVEHSDTAGSARDIAEGALAGHAAVCGEYAARLYGLDILESGIETNRRNFTRFLVLADPLSAQRYAPAELEVNKASLVFTLPHEQGALSKVLAILSFYDMNLTKIQSTPIVGREWEYRFYVDLAFSSPLRYRQALEAVRPLAGELRVLGEYTACTEEI